MPLRLGVFGGSFNPIHLGHLLVADDVRRRLRLDRVLFVPTCRPPHKHGPMTHYHHRLAMTKLAIAGEPGFELCRIEELRPGPSYTVDTLSRLKAMYAGAALYLILGSDQYREISAWYRPQLLARLARIVVMDRPGAPRSALFQGHDPRQVLFLAVIQVAVSAAAVRARLAKGHSVRYMLPVKVSEYVTRHHLYRRPKVSAG